MTVVYQIGPFDLSGHQVEDCYLFPEYKLNLENQHLVVVYLSAGKILELVQLNQL